MTTSSEETAVEEDESNGMNRGWKAVVGIIVILLFVWLIPSGKSSSQVASAPTPTVQSVNTPIVHTVALSETLSETVYPSTAGRGSRINWEIVEEDVPLITVINGKDRHYQQPRNSPDHKDLDLGDKGLSIAWAVPPGYRGTVTYTISPK